MRPVTSVECPDCSGNVGGTAELFFVPSVFTLGIVFWENTTVLRKRQNER